MKTDEGVNELNRLLHQSDTAWLVSPHESVYDY